MLLRFESSRDVTVGQSGELRSNCLAAIPSLMQLPYRARGDPRTGDDRLMAHRVSASLDLSHLRWITLAKRSDGILHVLGDCIHLDTHFRLQRMRSTDSLAEVIVPVDAPTADPELPASPGVAMLVQPCSDAPQFLQRNSLPHERDDLEAYKVLERVHASKTLPFLVRERRLKEPGLVPVTQLAGRKPCQAAHLVRRKQTDDDGSVTHPVHFGTRPPLPCTLPPSVLAIVLGLRCT